MTEQARLRCRRAQPKTDGPKVVRAACARTRRDLNGVFGAAPFVVDEEDEEEAQRPVAAAVVLPVTSLTVTGVGQRAEQGRMGECAVEPSRSCRTWPPAGTWSSGLALRLLAPLPRS